MAKTRTGILALLICLTMTGCKYVGSLMIFAGFELRVHDEAGYLTDKEQQEHELFLDGVFTRSDIDFHMAFVDGLEGLSIEEYAERAMAQYGVGKRSLKNRGLLYLHDTANNQIRIEVGYDLEGHFPDAFVRFVAEEHVASATTLEQRNTTLWGLQYLMLGRIHQAMLGYEWDPKALDRLRQRRAHLSGGAGANAKLSEARAITKVAHGERAEARKRLVPGTSPEETYARFLDWLALGTFDPRAEFLLPNAEPMLRQMSPSRAYAYDWYVHEAEASFEIDERGDLALLYFLDNPLLEPPLLPADRRLLYLDTVTEMTLIRQHSGIAYSWCWRPVSSPFTDTFGDLLFNAATDGCRRIRPADNRKLPMRYD